MDSAQQTAFAARREVLTRFFERTSDRINRAASAKTAGMPSTARASVSDNGNREVRKPTGVLVTSKTRLDTTVSAKPGKRAAAHTIKQRKLWEPEKQNV